MKHSLLLLLLLPVLLNAQTTTYTGHSNLKNRIKNYTLTDSITGGTFVLDTTNIYITAFDKSGKQLWRTDPWKDNDLGIYRVQRPVIVYYSLANSDRANKEEVIWITYQNTQFGYIDKKDGKFTFLGQD